MKKVLIGLLVAIILLVGVGIWQGENIVNALFYDMDATMDLPENLYDDDSLNNAAKKAQEAANTYVADVNDYLSLRAEAKKGSEVLAKLKPLTEMELLDDSDAPYIKVYVEELDKEGYVHEDYIVRKGDALSPAEE